MTAIVCPVCHGNPLTEDEFVALSDFVNEMQEFTIPEIVKIVKKRQELAAANRNKIIG